MAGRAQERLACQVIRRGTLAKWRCGSGRTRRQEDWSVKWLGGRNASFKLADCEQSFNREPWDAFGRCACEGAVL